MMGTVSYDQIILRNMFITKGLNFTFPSIDIDNKTLFN